MEALGDSLTAISDWRQFPNYLNDAATHPAGPEESLRPPESVAGAKENRTGPLSPAL